MTSGGEGHRQARSQTMPIIRGKNALMNPKLLQMMETGNSLQDVIAMQPLFLFWFFCLFYLVGLYDSYLILFPDGSIQDGDTLSPTDIEANLSTEVSLTVLDVLELFVHHHKVSHYFMPHNQNWN